MEWGFKNQTLDIRQEIDGIHFVLLEPLIYVRKNGDTIRSIIGLRSDGGSIPQVFQNLISSRGKLFWTYIQHDASYQMMTEKLLDNGTWATVIFSEQESNDLLKEAAESQKANDAEIGAVYAALEMFGWKAFREDRTKPSASAT